MSIKGRRSRLVLRDSLLETKLQNRGKSIFMFVLALLRTGNSSRERKKAKAPSLPAINGPDSLYFSKEICSVIVKNPKQRVENRLSTIPVRFEDLSEDSEFE